MSPQDSQSPARRLNLRDLLVASTITGILASMLFPVFSQARRDAHYATDLTHEQQMGSAIGLYAEDFDGNTDYVPAGFAAYLHGSPKHLSGPHYMYKRGMGPKIHFDGFNELLVYHGGLVLHNTTAGIIFWGTNWSSASFAGDVITGMQSWYQGMNNSGYAKTQDEYYDGAGYIKPGITLVGTAFDPTAAPNSDPDANTLNNEVCSQFPNPTPYGYYAIYSDTQISGVDYCAYHTVGSCNGVPIEYGWFPYIVSGDGCSINDPLGKNSVTLESLANISSHELEETRSDPQLDAWWDQNGNEVADKCAWTFGAVTDTLSNHTKWQMQGEWSNLHYLLHFGYPGADGAPGCIAGSQFTIN